MEEGLVLADAGTSPEASTVETGARHWHTDGQVGLRNKAASLGTDASRCKPGVGKGGISKHRGKDRPSVKERGQLRGEQLRLDPFPHHTKNKRQRDSEPKCLKRNHKNCRKTYGKIFLYLWHKERLSNYGPKSNGSKRLINLTTLKF